MVTTGEPQFADVSAQSAITWTLLNAMEKYGVDRGVASLCIGGGEATAVAVERAA